jgi:prevent-host-death family protein
MATYVEVGAYEAKTHLADFLRKVQAGAAYRITQRGKPVADLVPAATGQKRSATRAAARMGEFMRAQPALSEVDVRALLEEGRD